MDRAQDSWAAGKDGEDPTAGGVTDSARGLGLNPDQELQPLQDRGEERAGGVTRAAHHSQA